MDFQTYCNSAVDKIDRLFDQLGVIYAELTYWDLTGKENSFLCLTDCDISDVSLAKVTAPKAKKKKRKRGGKTVHRLRKSKRVKNEMLKSLGW